MTAPSFKAFFGDAERSFSLPPTLIIELERKTGVGIGALCQRLFNNQFSHADLTEVIRLGLIGGGTGAEEAAALVAAYAAGVPMHIPHALAVSILSALWFGTDDKVQNGQA